ncbi:hypothetical protein [Thiohalomonas denitrificans]|uniref:hypothetical protein n=1 Tax=Thiohalomonas denitrificans TaxID=415747 RepID=UPI0026E9A2D6|nr:hypothetical protein [Thiohalomonas denitrificans]
MLFQPAIIALLLADGLSLLLLVPAGLFAIRILRRWDLQSGSAQQIRLEEHTYLVTTGLALVFIAQILTLLLFVFTTDHLAVQFVGAMCAVGTLNANAWGFSALLLRMGLFLLAGTWLVMNYIDSRAYDYPLIRVKYALVLLIVPLALAAAGAQLAFFTGLDADVITSCCGSLFSAGEPAVTADLAGLPPLPAMGTFYTVLGLTILAGAWYALRGRGALLFAGLSAIAFPVSIAAVIAFISLYVYEHPHHHCPFCLLKSEYGYLGYGLYLPLFTATTLAVGLGITSAFAKAASVRAVLAGVAPRLAWTATLLFTLFMLQAIWFTWRSNLILLGE